MATGSASGPGGVTIHAWAFFTSKHNWRRNWQNQSSGYADVQGTWYAATRTRSGTFNCSG
jgi:hypothetical protein